MRISLVNVTKSLVSCGFGHIYWRNPQWKTSFFVQWKISSTYARKMLCLDYSNLHQSTIDYAVNYASLLEGIYFLYMVLEMNVLNGIFYKRKMFQLKYHWVQIKYLSAIQNRRGQLFCLRDKAFSQYTPAFVSAVVACWRELERLYIYSIYIQISL